MTRTATIVALCAIALATTLGSLVLIALPRTTPLPDVYGFHGAGAIFSVVLTLVGAAIALRRPENSVGWIFLASAVGGGILQLSSEYGSYALIERRGELAAGEWAAWVGGWGLAFFVGPISTYLLLLFPDGRLPSPRWQPVLWLTTISLLAWVLDFALAPGPISGNTYANNPLWPAGTELPSWLALLPKLISTLFVVPPVALCAAALVHRFRGARGVERQQLKWIAYAGAILAIGVAMLPATQGNKPLQVVQMSTVLAVPLAAGVAILWHRLYDIDLLIKRTLVYGSLSAILVAVYVVAVIMSEALLRPLTGGSELSVATSTLLVVALFQPVRHRVQAAVDRRFYRARYDAARALDAFSVHLRDEVALEAVRGDLLDAVGQTVQPATVSLWLRERTS